MINFVPSLSSCSGVRTSSDVVSFHFEDFTVVIRFFLPSNSSTFPPRLDFHRNFSKNTLTSESDKLSKYVRYEYIRSRPRRLQLKVRQKHKCKTFHCFLCMTLSRANQTIDCGPRATFGPQDQLIRSTGRHLNLLDKTWYDVTYFLQSSPFLMTSLVNKYICYLYFAVCVRFAHCCTCV